MSLNKVNDLKGAYRNEIHILIILVLLGIILSSVMQKSSATVLGTKHPPVKEISNYDIDSPLDGGWVQKNQLDPNWKSSIVPDEDTSIKEKNYVN